MREQCGIIATRQEGLSTPNFSGRDPRFVDGEYLAECVLPRCHNTNKHIFKTPDGIYIAWEEDWECGCCDADEEDRCTIYGEISKKEAKELGVLI